MDDPAYAWRITQHHFGCFRSHWPDEKPFTCLELGPGDSLNSAIFARAFGAARTLLVDVADFAGDNVDGWRSALEYATALGYDVPGLSHEGARDEALESCSAEYLVRGLSSLRAVPSGSVDFIWSNAVLEHVGRSQFLELMTELRRITSPAGMGSHAIDLKDHLGGGLHNLHFPSRVWESPFFSKSGFYT
ncbi:MAG: class I SAM-dependent methyltransferase, partial [Actinomycetota bacterium]|nr:class I SAM-dependent methyltransferase [Actinomycetota bacterium]